MPQKAVYDRKLPTKIPAAQLESQRKGLNEKTLNESLADSNMGVDITE